MEEPWLYCDACGQLLCDECGDCHNNGDPEMGCGQPMENEKCTKEGE